MFASVAYSDGKKAIVPTATIKNFDPQNYEKKQKYKILWADDGHYYDGVILSVKETKEEAQKEMEERRMAVPNFVYCKSSTDLKEIFDKEDKKLQHPKAAAKAAVTDVDDIVRKKLTAVAARKNVQAVKKKTEDGLDGAPPSKKGKGLKPVGKGAKTAENEPKSAGKEAKSAESRSKSIEKKTATAEVGPKSIEKETKTAEPRTKSIEKETRTAEHRTKSIEKETKAAENGPKTTGKVPKITEVSTVQSKITIVDSRSEGEKSADNTEPSGSKMASLIRENKELRALNSVLKKENQQLKKLNQEQKAEVEDLRCLNSDALRTCVDLNKNVISNFEQLCACLEFFLKDGRFQKKGIVMKETHIYNVGNYVSEYISDLKKKARNENEPQPSTADHHTDEVKEKDDQENCDIEEGEQEKENDQQNEPCETHMEEDDDDTEEIEHNVESEENNNEFDKIDELEGIDDKSETD